MPAPWAGACSAPGAQRGGDEAPTLRPLSATGRPFSPTTCCATYHVQRADQRPNLQTQSNATRQRTPAYLNATSTSQVQAVVGLAAFEVDLSERFTGGQRSWSFTPQISLPSFDAGRNRANLDLATLFKVLSEAWNPPRDGGA